MFSASRRRMIASLLAAAIVAVLGLPSARAEDDKGEKVLSPEKILKDGFVGKATVELQVGEVRTLDIDSVFVPDASHAQTIEAKLPGEKAGRKFVVTVSRETATRLRQLGIDDVAEHVRGKVLRVSGTVELVKRTATAPEVIYRLPVANLDQFESIHKP